MVSTQPVSASDVPQGTNIFISESGYASGMWGLNRWSFFGLKSLKFVYSLIVTVLWG